MTASVAVAVFGVTVLFCGLAYLVVRYMLIEDFDRTVLEQFHSVANTVEVWGHGDIYLEFNPSVMTRFAAGRGSRFYRAERSRQCLDRTLHRPRCPGPHAPVLPGTTASGSTFGAGLAPNGAEALVVAQVVSTRWGWDPLETDIETPLDVRETQINLIVAVDRTPLQQRLRVLALSIALITTASAVAAADAVFAAIQGAFRPLRDLAHRAAQIREPIYDPLFAVDDAIELRPLPSVWTIC